MKKQLFTIALAFLLLPLIQACGDSGAGGSTPAGGKPGGVRPDPLPLGQFMTVNKTEINLGDVKVGDNLNFDFTVTSVTNREFVLRSEVIINSIDGNLFPNTKMKFTPCNGKVEESWRITINPLEVCLINVSFTVTTPSLPYDNRSIRNVINLMAIDEPAVTWTQVDLPINYNVK